MTARVYRLAILLVLAGCTHARPSVAPKSDPRAERTLVADLDAIFGAPAMAQGLWGVEVRSLATGRALYARNPYNLMMPASNMKILTLAAAAETLGWDYRFKTTLETAGAISGGVLTGDLIVRGTGDPTINTRANRASALFDEWAAALRAAGVTRIDGRVLADARAFDDRSLGAGWSWDYLQDGYAAPIGALELNEDTARLSVRAGPEPGDPLGIDLTAGAGLRLLNHTVTGDAGSPLTLAFERTRDEPVLLVTGALALDANPALRDVAVVNPAAYFAQGLKDALDARGIAVSGQAFDAAGLASGPPQTRQVLVESLSPPLRDIATVMMKVSQNLYAETLLKAVGAARGAVGTAEGGRDAARALFISWGVRGDYVQADGSGLSRYDYVTADMLATILEHLYKDPRHHEAFLATLPIAGQDGTVASRMKKTRAEGNALAKTGSISNVRTLSGYVKTRDGETLVFSILANSFTIPAATVNGIADRAVERLSDYSAR